MNDSFICSHCSTEHSRIQLSFAADFPDSYANLSRSERDTRALISSDQCVLDQKHFFIRGCLEIPVLETDRVFLWGLWALVHERDYDEIDAHWETSGRETMIGPYKGRLANSVSLYPETFNLKLEIEIQPASTRPLFRLEEPDHPLALEQQNGITMQKAEEYACLLMRLSGAS